MKYYKYITIKLLLVLSFFSYTMSSPQTLKTGMLNTIQNHLATYPQETVHLIQAAEILKQILKLTDKIDDVEIEKQHGKLVEKMIVKINNFFTGLHCFGIKDAVKPMIKESLENANLDTNTSYLYGFFEADTTEHIDEYVAITMHTKSELQVFCTELSHFLKDLQETMPTVFKNGKLYLEGKIKEAQHKKEESEPRAT